MTVVLGAKGQLGSELTKLLGDKARYLDSDQLDLTDTDKIRLVVRELKPTLLINAAAYTAVDKAESEQDLAFKVNAEAPGVLAELSASMKFKFIHVSTDYVFDGESAKPYVEADKINPVNFYGASKAEGEKRVLSANPDSVIVRTAWVHSLNGKSFLNTVLRLASEKKSMKVVDDAIGSPTWARDLANVLIKSRELSGVFHFSNEGLCSWFDFAVAIRRFGRLDLPLTPVPSTAFPTPARRPKFSLLDKSKIKAALGMQIPHWMESLEKCLSERT